MEPDMVMVTLETQSGTNLGDFELPARLPAGKLSDMLLQALSNQLPFWRGLKLIGDGKVLDEKDTLASRGIWDGSYLTIAQSQGPVGKGGD